MPGLGQRLLGATVRGAGLGIVEEAKQRREDTLLALRRKWQVEDREAAADLTRKGWDRADARAAAGREHQGTLTREGWDRADARADASREHTGRPLVPVLDDDGSTIYVPQGEAAGRRVPPKSSGKPDRLYPIEDERGNIVGYKTREEALAETRTRGKAAAGASADAKAAQYVSENGGIFTSNKTAFGGDPGRFQALLAGLIADNPSRPISELAQKAKRLNKRPEGVPANAVQPPPGKRGQGRWYVPDGKGGWLDVTPEN